MDLAHLANLGVRRDRPLRTPPTTPLMPLALYAAGAAIVLGGDSLVVAPVSLALLGLAGAVQLFDRRRRLRAEADAWLARGYENRTASRYGWRIDELTSPRERRLLPASLRAVVRELSERRRLGAVPLNRKGLRPCRAELAGLAAPQAIGNAADASQPRAGDPVCHQSAAFGEILHHLEVRP